MEQEIKEIVVDDEDEGGWAISRSIKKNLKKMDAQLDKLWAMGEIKEREQKVGLGLLSN